MADVRPFHGWRYASPRLSAVLCPPYDVIGSEQARLLRRVTHNAIHMELPRGEGPAKYRRAAALWRAWCAKGVLARDDAPAFYLVEQCFRLGGRSYRRLGFLAGLGVTPKAARAVIAHERTLSKPKTDRLRLLAAVKANVSPIFGVFADPGGAIARLLRRAACGRPDASGRAPDGTVCRLWRLDAPALAAELTRRLKSARVFIADGHHRFEVSKAYYVRTRSKAAETVLAYLCPEGDPGLVVLPTHRVVKDAAALPDPAAQCALSPCRTSVELWRKLKRSQNPYAFGFIYRGRWLAEPRRASGCKSGLAVEWLKSHLLKDVSPEALAYTHDAAEAEALSRGAAAVLVKPFSVAQVRRAVDAVGLLPQKSTYFYPKVPTGLVFKALE